MLHMILAPLEEMVKRDDFIRYPDAYFDGVWEEDWLSDSFGRSVIQAVDKVQLGANVEQSLLLSGMRVEDLCTGTKNLLLCKHLSKLNRLAYMGPNCYTFLLDAAEDKDIAVGMSSTLFMRNEHLRGRTVHFVNDDSFVNNEWEFFNKVIDLQDAGFLD